MNEKSFDTISRIAEFLNSPNANTTSEAINGLFKFLEKREEKIKKNNSAT